MFRETPFQRVLKKILAYRTPILLICIFLIAVVSRGWLVYDGSFVFGYDQARDAVLSQEIIQGDFKIFGPTASGTKDSVFHGVLYYYLLAAIYSISLDPQVAAFILSVVAATAIVPAYFLGKELSSNEWIGLFVALCTAISFQHVTSSVWLSNPTLAVVALPLFFFSSIRLAKSKQMNWAVLAGLSLGVVMQAIIFGVFWVIPVLFLFLKDAVEVKWQFNKRFLQRWAGFTVTFVVSISSMILSELLMIHRGILTFSLIQEFNSGGSFATSDELIHISRLFFDKIGSSLLPGFGIFALLSLTWMFWKAKRNSIKQSEYLVILFFTPIIFLSLYFRDSPHVFIGFEVLLYALVAAIVVYAVIQRLQSKLMKGIVLSSIIMFFFATNLIALRDVSVSRNHPNSIQKGFLYRDQIELIQETYSIADGEKFTIATLTNPFRIHVTWAYLYDFLGNKRYGYEPKYMGSSQTGYVGQGLLEKTDHVESIHFAIVEPDTGISSVYVDEFFDQQFERVGTASAERKFGSLRLVVYQK